MNDLSDLIGIKKEREMTDASTGEWSLVLTAPGKGLYIHLPLSQVEEVCQRLDRAWIPYRVNPQAISIAGGPKTTFIRFSPDICPGRILSALGETP